MGLDSYSRRNLDQLRKDSQVVDEIEQMNLDSDLKAKLREAKMNLEMEKVRLERQDEYDKIINEVNPTSTRSMDLIPFPDINLNGLSSNQPTQQEESITNFGQRYSEEEKQQAKESLQQSIKAGEDLLAMLEANINEYNNSDSLDEEYSPRHR